MAERITLEGVSKVYPGGSRALQDVGLDVAPGTFLVLLGPSGSGKTTLLRSLAGIERISGGRITIGAATVADGRVHVPPERRDLSMVFQDYALWPHLAAADNARSRCAGGACRARSAGTARGPCRTPVGRTSAPHRGEHHLAGTVADVAFRGRGYEFAVDVPGHGRLTGVFARHRAARGETVGLRLEPEGCHFFPAAGPDGGAGASAPGPGGEGLTQAPPDVHALSG
ncbi:MAG: ATP-binding cassette domain-containing protein [Gemmatimonadota bacterium]